MELNQAVPLFITPPGLATDSGRQIISQVETFPWSYERSSESYFAEPAPLLQLLMQSLYTFALL